MARVFDENGNPVRRIPDYLAKEYAAKGYRVLPDEEVNPKSSFYVDIQTPADEKRAAEVKAIRDHLFRGTFPTLPEVEIPSPLDERKHSIPRQWSGWGAQSEQIPAANDGEKETAIQATDATDTEPTGDNEEKSDTDSIWSQLYAKHRSGWNI
ncbi:MAG: hypothetical protein CXR31_09745 [Geobacter sp.]|nr:MAG: hypothetical protein CXR31_09745 [Geobacter sp.]